MAREKQKKSVLDEWRQRRSREMPAVPKVTPKEVAVTDGQYRIWFLQQLFPKNPFYHYAELHKITGSLDRTRLIRAFEKVVERHEILRTRFQVKSGEVIQIVEHQFDFDFNEFDLNDESTACADDRLSEIAVEEARKPFDLQNGPLSRLTLVRLPDNLDALLISMHHIITDKSSMNVIRNELAAFYRDEETVLPPLKIQFRDAAFGERKNQDDGGLLFWEEKLADANTFIDLPTDKIRPPVPTFQGSYLKREIPNDISKRIFDSCKKNNVTPYVFMLAVYQIFVSKYSGSNDVLVGSPFSARETVELEKLIGFFNDTVLLRGQPNPEKPFEEYLAEVTKTVGEAFQHQNVPFETIVKKLTPKRAMSHNPLFQTMFIYHREAALPNFGDGLDVSIEPLDLGVSKFDLTYYVAQNGDDLTSIFEFATDLFDTETVNQMHDGFQNLLRSVLDDSSLPIGDYSLLSGEENQRITTEFSGSGNTSESKPILGQIINITVSNPDSPAAVYEGTKITYGELAERSSSVAAYLSNRNCVNKPIAVIFKPGLEMFSGMIGVLRSGAHYIPLEPDTPPRRLAQILKDSGAAMILTGDGALENAPLLSNIDVVQFDSIPDSEFVDIEIPGDSTAYIIYTSGSTGTPKGVAVSHRNLAVSTAARFEYYKDQPDSFLLLSPYSFDSSVAGIYWTLCSGGKLVVLPKRVEQDVERLSQIITNEAVTHTLTLPSLYDTFLNVLDQPVLRRFSTVILAGEACSTALCEKHFGTSPGTTLFNEYGPTETTVWATVHQITAEDIGRAIPIGKPIPNYRAYVLDNELSTVPVGIVGELYIAGEGVAAYLESGKDTSDAFVPDIFCTGEKRNMYKTGDRCAWNADGTLRFCGRADGQVKLRGFRIELEEIGSQIRSLPTIKEAAVTIKSREVKGEEMSSIKVLEKMKREDAEKILLMVENLSDSEAGQMLKTTAKAVS
jgi:amino acid adenylation domain-containing protein